MTYPFIFLKIKEEALKKLISLLLAGYTQISISGYEATDYTTIDLVRSHSALHPNAAGLVTFRVQEALKGGCYELVIDAKTDKVSYSHLLAAHAQKLPAQLSYQTNDFTYWPGGCWLQSITVK